jgi:hypothetical protein
MATSTGWSWPDSELEYQPILHGNVIAHRSMFARQGSPSNRQSGCPKKYCPFDARGLDAADFRFGAMPSERNTDNTYKLQVSLNAAEYLDVIEDITQHTGTARETHIIELLRSGLQATRALQTSADWNWIKAAKRPANFQFGKVGKKETLTKYG